jgi:hypothetical protein
MSLEETVALQGPEATARAWRELIGIADAYPRFTGRADCKCSEQGSSGNHSEILEHDHVLQFGGTLYRRDVSTQELQR